MSRDTYRWTARRLITGVVIVLAGAAVVWLLVARYLHEQGPAPSRVAARLQRTGEQLQSAALRHFNGDDLRIDAGDILPGGPPKGGIAALTDPAVVAAADVDWLAEHPRVIGVTVNGVSRAYPLKLLMRHELVNDTLGGTPICVAYCPLCDSVSVFERSVNGSVREFGVSGLLLHSNVLLFDRSNDALWSQLAPGAVSGPDAGATPRHLRWSLLDFQAWRTAHPGGTVLSADTGAGFDYDRLPYPGYFDDDRLYVPMRPDRRRPLKERVVGVRIGDERIAIPLEAVAAQPGGRLEHTFPGGRLVLESRPGGIAVIAAPPDAIVVHTFWFAWAAFHPDTRIHGEAPPAPVSTNRSS